MNLKKIKEISQGKKELERRLTLAYISNLSPRTLISIIKSNELDNSYNNYLRKILSNFKNPKTLNYFAKELLSMLTSSANYSKIRIIVCYLGDLHYHVLPKHKKKFINFLISSGKWSLKKYAYSIDPKLPNYKLLFNEDWVSNNQKEACYMLNVVLYDKDFVNNNFEKLFNLIATIEWNEAYIKALFTSKKVLKKENWAWLKSNIPHYYIYFVKQKKRPISDKECIWFYCHSHNGKCSLDEESYHDYLISSFAHMNKWKVVETILKDFVKFNRK